jgi:hypothetical protein
MSTGAPTPEARERSIVGTQTTRLEISQRGNTSRRFLEQGAVYYGETLKIKRKINCSEEDEE